MTVAALGLTADSRSLQAAIPVLREVAKASGEAEKAADRLAGKSAVAGKEVASEGRAADRASGQNKKLRDAVTDTGAGMRRLATIAGTLAGTLAAAFSARAIINYADAWSDMQSKVGAAIKDMSAAPELMGRMVDLANASYSPLDQTVEVYSRNVGVLRSLGKSATEAADFTEALNHALVITATKGEQAASVQNALSKAMAVGKLQADGLETVMANGGRVAEALAERLGTNVNGLRNMASQGKITAAVIAGAMLDSLEKLRSEAGEMPATVADGMTRIGTGLQYLIGVMDQTTGASGSLAGVLVLVGDALANAAKWASENGDTIQFVFDSVIGTSIAGATALAARFAVTWVASMYASATATGALSAALVTLRGALIATGIGAVVVAAGVLIGQFLRLVSAAGGFGNALELVTNVGREAVERLELGFQGVGRVVASVAAGLRAAFASAFASILQKFADLTTSIADGVNSMFAPLGINLGLTGVGAGMAADVAAYAEEEGRVATRQADAAAIFFKGMTAPFKSIEAMRDVLGSTKDEVEGIGAAAAPAGQALEDMGGKGAKAGKETKDAITDLQKATEDFKGTMSQAFTGLVTGAHSLRDAVGNIIGKLAEMAAMRGFEMLWGGGMGSGVGGFLGALLGFANGAAFQGGRVTAFADGGVVSGPTNFPMRGGVGLMGEAGPEAIMPLKRGADGKLGVTMSRGGGTSPGGKLSISIGFDASIDAFRATVRDETGQIVAQGIQQATPSIVSRSVSATGSAMNKTKSFGNGGTI